MRKFNAEDYSDLRKTNMEPGWYTVMLVDDSATKFVNRKTALSGNEYLSLTYKILEPQEHRGLCFWDVQSFGEKALNRFAAMYKAVEPEKTNRREFDLDSDEDLHDALYYKPLKIYVNWDKQEGYADKLRPRKFRPIIGEEYDQMMDLAQDLLNDPNTGSEWGAGPRTGRSNEGESTFTMQSMDDDDVPF